MIVHFLARLQQGMVESAIIDERRGKMKARILLASAAIFLFGCEANTTPQHISTTTQPQTDSIVKPIHPSPIISIPESTIKEPEKLQSDRRNFVISLIRKGFFDRIEMPATLPRVWVSPVFMSLDFQTKSKYVEIVYAYYFDSPNRKNSEQFGDTVLLKDVYSGKTIGSYNPWAYGGLKLR